MGPKDQDWFSKLNARTSESPDKANEPKRFQIGLTKEDEKAIAISLIPQYVQRQKELQPQYDHIRQVGEELKHLKKEYNIADVRQAKPMQFTSFMTLTNSQLKEYELKTKATRERRLFSNQTKSRMNKRSPREMMAPMERAVDDYNSEQPKPFQNYKLSNGIVSTAKSTVQINEKPTDANTSLPPAGHEQPSTVRSRRHKHLKTASNADEGREDEDAEADAFRKWIEQDH